MTTTIGARSRVAAAENGGGRYAAELSARGDDGCAEWSGRCYGGARSAAELSVCGSDEDDLDLQPVYLSRSGGGDDGGCNGCVRERVRWQRAATIMSAKACKTERHFWTARYTTARVETHKRTLA